MSADSDLLTKREAAEKLLEEIAEKLNAEKVPTIHGTMDSCICPEGFCSRAAA
jgi:hypothetical protein